MEHVPDSVMRMEAVRAATATSYEGEVLDDFMARVNTIYSFLCKTSGSDTDGAPHGASTH